MTDIEVYGCHCCDDKFAGNQESYRISVPEYAGRDMNGKRLRRVLERLVVVKNDGFPE